ncbi:PEBP-like protein [Aspergillus japonicus CBS 114.51]|uniref:PEBP-like protein n=1 Tax=Aspergillus japonicus CBS 114.51 TaxID=1448312 RepID=A0A8T8WLE3_ASPJA|nr:PEBP-like protein [Aspergillus japonicus CBS 114.51]RAH76533.1 PEBP-like protein [Aspergillus japonicus CBS 114.51]
MEKLPPRIEAFLGRLLANKKGRDARLLTRCCAALRALEPTIEITSPIGPSHSTLPLEYTPLAANRFPPLAWSLPPSVERTLVDSYVLIVEDPDAPLPSPVVHGLYYGIPGGTCEVGPEHFLVADGGSDNRLEGQFRYGRNWHNNVWSGPRPVLEHGEHRYFFQLIALKAAVRMKGHSVTKEQLVGELSEENVLGWGEWVGTFERTR